jgi:NADPH:quinone reductase-like Zn-dependent oxidoreductase
MYAIQLAKLCLNTSGQPMRVYATASPRNHAFLKSLGVDGVVDYRSPTWPEEVLQMSGGISYGYDCLSEGSSTGKMSMAFGPSGGRIAVIRSAAFDRSLIRDGVEAVYGAVWSGLGVEIGYNG